MPKKRLLYIGNKLQGQGKSPTGIDTLGLWLEEDGYSVLFKSSQKNQILRLLDMIFGAIRNRNKIDIVLIDTYSTRNFYYAVIIASLCRLFKLQYIPILRGGNLPERLQRSKFLSRSIFKNAKTNIAPSLYLMENFKSRGYANLSHIPNSLRIENYPFKLRNTIKCRLLWVRSFSEIYNPLLALEIVEQLQKAGVFVELCMVGAEKDGSLARCKKVAFDLNLPIKFTGKLEKAEWIHLSKDYDVFINTTNFDNMPVSVMEAMALGIPVISTNVGGISYLLENNKDGLLLPPNNAMAFVESIQDLLSNSAKVEGLSSQARKKMETYDWKNIKYRWDFVLSDEAEKTYE